MVRYCIYEIFPKNILTIFYAFQLFNPAAYLW